MNATGQVHLEHTRGKNPFCLGKELRKTLMEEMILQLGIKEKAGTD